MKKIFIIFVTIAAFMIGFIVYVNLSGIYVNVHKLQLSESEKLIEYLKASDSESVKSMFCERTICNCENIDEQISELIAVFGGKIDSYGEITGGGEEQYTKNGKITRLSYDVTINDVVTNDGQKYKIQFVSVPVNDEYPDYIGFELIGVDNNNGSVSFNIGKRV